jgi:uncharacterized protein YukE
VLSLKDSFFESNKQENSPFANFTPTTFDSTLESYFTQLQNNSPQTLPDFTDYINAFDAFFSSIFGNIYNKPIRSYKSYIAKINDAINNIKPKEWKPILRGNFDFLTQSENDKFNSNTNDYQREYDRIKKNINRETSRTQNYIEQLENIKSQQANMINSISSQLARRYKSRLEPLENQKQEIENSDRHNISKIKELERTISDLGKKLEETQLEIMKLSVPMTEKEFIKFYKEIIDDKLYKIILKFFSYDPLLTPDIINKEYIEFIKKYIMK